VLIVIVGSAYDVLKEALLKRADVPLAITTSSDRSTLADDLHAAGLDSPAITVTPAPPAGRPVSPMAGLFNDLAEIDGSDLARPGGSGLCSSAYDLHKTGLSSATTPFRRRFNRSRSHQNLLRIDVRTAASPSDNREHLATSTPKLFPNRSPRLLPTCVRRPRDDSATDCLSASMDLAIRSSGTMILQICGIDVSTAVTATKSRKVRSLNL